MVGRAEDMDKNDKSKMMLTDPEYLYYAKPKNVPVKLLKRCLTVTEYTLSRR